MQDSKLERDSNHQWTRTSDVIMLPQIDMNLATIWPQFGHNLAAFWLPTNRHEFGHFLAFSVVTFVSPRIGLTIWTGTL